MFVVFIHGPAASGKHTIGALLADRMGLPLFHNHLAVDLAKSLFEFGTPGFRRLRAGVWLQAYTEAAQADVSFVFTFHPEATVEADLIDGLVDIVQASGGEVLFVELTCPRATILERLGNDSRKRFGKLTDPDLYAAIEQDGGFEFATLPAPIIRIDTASLDPHQAAAAIEAAIADRQTG